MRGIKIAFVMSVILSLSLCMAAGSSAEDTHDAGVYYPLAAGDSWTYKFGDTSDTVRYDVTGYSNEYGGYVVKRVAKMIDVTLTTELVIGSGAGKVEIIGGDEIRAGKKMMLRKDRDVLLKSPVTAGASWEYPRDNLDNDLECRVRCRVVSVSAMDVKAGHFKDVCMVERTASYLDKDGTEKYRDVHNEYYAQNVGLIRDEVVEDATDALRTGHSVKRDKPLVIVELLEYKINR